MWQFVLNIICSMNSYQIFFNKLNGITLKVIARPIDGTGPSGVAHVAYSKTKTTRLLVFLLQNACEICVHSLYIPI